MVEESHAASAPDVPAAPSFGGAPPPPPPPSHPVRTPSRDCVGLAKKGGAAEGGPEGQVFRAAIPNLPRVFRNDFLRILRAVPSPKIKGLVLTLKTVKKEVVVADASPVFLRRISFCALRVRKRQRWHLGRS